MGMTLSDDIAARSLDQMLPRPRRVERLDGTLRLVPGAHLVTAAAGGQAAARLATLVGDAFGVKWPVGERSQCPAGQLWLVPDGSEGTPPDGATPPEASYGDEAYRLTIGPWGAVVAANGSRGLLWGAMALWQALVPQDGALVAPALAISDWPRYAWRGFMFDSGRAPNSPAKMRRIIRICSAFRLNCFILREGDDELNAVRYRRLPLGTRNPCALGMDEVAALSDYARGLGVTLVPEIEALGHSAAKGMHYPDLVDGGIETIYEGIGVHRRKMHLHPADPRVLDLLRAMLDEWMPILPSPNLHLGLDEVLMPREPQAEHLARLLAVIDALSERYGQVLAPVVWADAPATPEPWRGRVVRCLWSYAEHDSHGAIGTQNDHLLRQGIAELARPGADEPAWMAGGSGSRHTPYTKSPAVEAIANLAEWARWGEPLANVHGLLAVQWSGNTLDDWLPDFLAAAEYGWRPPEAVPDADAALARIRAALARVRDAAHPAADEVDPPAWDGIWLEGTHWGKEIVPRPW